MAKKMLKYDKTDAEASVRAELIVQSLREFCDDIDQTGGLVLHGEGSHYVPAASDDWIDLGETYLKACKALRRKPKIAEED